MKTFWGLFSSEGDIAWVFDIHPQKVKKYVVLFAMFDEDNYAGAVFVLLMKDEKFSIVYCEDRNPEYFHVHFHPKEMSGFEGQWKPKRISKKALKKIDFSEFFEEDKKIQKDMIFFFHKLLNTFGKDKK